MLAMFFAAPVLAGCLGDGDQAAAHATPLVLLPTTATGDGWTNPQHVVGNDGTTYASTLQREKVLYMTTEDSTFTGTITRVEVKVEQQQVNQKDDSWYLYVYEESCGDMVMGNLNPQATSTKTILTSTASCPAGWTWTRINNAIPLVYTIRGGNQVEGEWRVYRAWLEVTFTNNAPVADAGDDQTVVESTVFTLDGSASSDPDGARDPLTYQWTQVAGPAVTLLGATTATPSFTAPTLSTNDPVGLDFELVVTDPNLDTGTDRVAITVTNVNTPPVARAGADQTINEGVQVTLDGSGSSDADGDTLTYTWTQTVGPTVTLSDASSASPTFTAPDVSGQDPFDLAFRLAVHDGFTTSEPDDVAVRVDNVNAVPTVSAGDEQTVDEGTLVALEAVGDDADGDTLSYTWSQTAGTTVTLSGADSSTATLTAPMRPTSTDVTLTFSVTASDGLSVSAESTVDVIVQNVNQAPVAEAGANQTTEEGAAVTLDGTGSSDPDADSLTYAWTQAAGPVVGLSDASAARPSFTAPDLATNDPVALQFRLIVSDGALESAADTVTVTVQNINQPPVAQAGPDADADEGTTVTLDGSGSNDVDADELTYTWTQTSGPSVALEGATTAQPSFVAPMLATNDPVTLTFSLVVQDGLDQSEPDTVSIQILNINQAPIADAGDDASVDEATPVGLDGTGSTDADSDPLSYSWTQTSGPSVTLSGATTAQPTFTAPAVPTNEPVTLAFRLIVSDGLTFSAGDAVTITVMNVNQAPVLTPPADASVDEEQPVTLAAEATDADSDTLTYQWIQTGGPAVELQGAATDTLAFTAPTVPTADDVLLSFVVSVDDGIAPAVTAGLTVTVQNVNAAPVVHAGGDQTVDEGSLVTLNGTASDQDGDALQLTWTQVSGPAVNLTDTTSATATFTAPMLAHATPIEIVVRLAATDGVLTTGDEATLSVVNANQDPVAVPGNDQSVDAGSFVTLDGSDSYDPDGDALSYQWLQTSGPTVTLAGAATATPSFTSPSTDATIVLTLTVTDVLGAESAPKSVVVTSTAATVEETSPTTGATETTGTTAPVPGPTAVGAAAFPSSLLVEPGEAGTIRIRAIDDSGLAVDDGLVSCAWDDATSGGTLAPLHDDPCGRRYTTGPIAGLSHQVLATATLATGQTVDIVVPVTIAFAPTTVPVDADDPKVTVATCEAHVPGARPGTDIPFLFRSGCGLHSIILVTDETVDGPSMLRVRVLSEHADLPEELMQPSAVMLDITWLREDGSPVKIRKASVSFLINSDWRDAYCPAGLCHVVLFHEKTEGWSQVDATLVAKEDKFERYQATVTSFSIFVASGVLPGAAAVPPSEGAPRLVAPWVAAVAIAALAILVVAAAVAARGRTTQVEKPAEKEQIPPEAQGSLAAMLREIRQEDVVKFVNEAAHDMSSPISTLAIQLRLLAIERADDEDDDRTSLAVMGRSVDQLATLVRDLRDAAQLQAGKLSMDPMLIDLSDHLKETAETLDAKATEAGVELRVDTPDPLPVKVDPRRMTRVLTNLIENALKFTGQGGTIDVRGTIEGHDVVVRVADSGIGMTEEQAAVLFHPFTQVHGPTAKEKGSGLGLYICKGIIEQHGGRIEVERTQPGRGTVFRFTLPVDETAGPATETGPE
jgi:signal transduction histidine kinase